MMPFDTSGSETSSELLNGNLWQFTVLGMDECTSRAPAIDAKRLRQVFAAVLAPTSPRMFYGLLA
jgi:hypothetical protein